MNTLHHYMTRTTLQSGQVTFKTVIKVSLEAMFNAACEGPDGSKLEFTLLGIGLPAIRSGRRLFHTDEQAKSYEAGYNNRSASSTLPELDDFRDLGIMDADKDEAYRQEARECAARDYDGNNYEGND